MCDFHNFGLIPRSEEKCPKMLILAFELIAQNHPKNIFWHFQVRPKIMKIIHIVYIYIPSPYPLQQELELLQEEGCKAFFEDGGRGLQETHRAAITAKLSLLRGIFLNPPHTPPTASQGRPTSNKYYNSNKTVYAESIYILIYLILAKFTCILF